MAPFDGEIVKKAVELGSFVGPGIARVRRGPDRLVKIVVGVPDTALPSVRSASPSTLRVDAVGDRTFQARISRIASAADSTDRKLRGRGRDPEP